MAEIDEWWPLLNEPIREWIVNNYYSPLAPFTLGEIERHGGPAADDPYWKREADGLPYLPSEAIQWLIGCADFSQMRRPKEPDPRAAYFKLRGTCPYNSSRW